MTAWVLRPGPSRVHGCRSDGRPPVALGYHELMMHSVWNRSVEIERWADIDLLTASELLATEYEALRTQLSGAQLAPALQRRALDSIEHLPAWSEALTGA